MSKNGVMADMIALDLEQNAKRIGYKADAEGIKRNFELQQDVTERLRMQWQNFLVDLSGKLTGRFKGAVNDLFEAMNEGTLTMENFKEGFRAFMIGILQDIQQAIIDEYIGTFIENMVGKLTGKLANLGAEVATDAPEQIAATAAVGKMSGASATLVGGIQSIATVVSESFDMVNGLLTARTGGVQLEMVAVGTDLGSALTALASTVESISSLAVARIYAAEVAATAAYIGGPAASGGMITTKGGAGYVSGGRVRHMAAGGAALRDRVPMLLEPGEFVIRKPIAKAIPECPM